MVGTEEQQVHMGVEVQEVTAGEAETVLHGERWPTATDVHAVDSI